LDKTILNKIFWWTVFGVITFGSLAPSDNIPPEISTLNDKWLHFFMYAIFCTAAWSGLIAYHKNILETQRVLLAYVFSIFYGGFMELMQYYVVPGRYGDILDFVANTIGSSLSVTLILIYQWIAKKMK
jgi:VanZ family protein